MRWLGVIEEWHSAQSISILLLPKKKKSEAVKPFFRHQIQVLAFLGLTIITVLGLSMMPWRRHLIGFQRFYSIQAMLHFYQGAQCVPWLCPTPSHHHPQPAVLTNGLIEWDSWGFLHTITLLSPCKSQQRTKRKVQFKCLLCVFMYSKCHLYKYSEKNKNT